MFAKFTNSFLVSQPFRRCISSSMRAATHPHVQTSFNSISIHKTTTSCRISPTISSRRYPTISKLLRTPINRNTRTIERSPGPNSRHAWTTPPSPYCHFQRHTILPNSLFTYQVLRKAQCQSVLSWSTIRQRIPTVGCPRSIPI